MMNASAYCRTSIALLVTILAPLTCVAQSAVATVAAGTTPIAVEANPVTHKVYVVNHGSNSVTIVDGVTRATSTVFARPDVASMVRVIQITVGGQ